MGKWSIVNIDATVGRITQLPDRAGHGRTLEEFRKEFRERYSGKYLEFTKEKPHTFLIPVPYEGRVRGCINGAWMPDPKDKQVVNVYKWVSGHVYELWGRASLKNGKMEVVIVRYGNPSPVLVCE
ncbi:MAG: hypothetical protein JW849_03605 [Phycisphaerae bacterium]|nr:hypothetical protein [Phycisphaerae bacterium]